MKASIEGIKETFEAFDKVVNLYPFECLVAVTEDIYKNAKENVEPHWKTGRLENNLDYRVHKKTLESEVYIMNDGMMVNWDNKSLNYALFVHFGTKDHDIVPKKKKALRWATVDGWVFAKKVHVSGIKPDPFMYNALQKTMQDLDTIFKKVYDELQK